MGLQRKRQQAEHYDNLQGLVRNSRRTVRTQDRHRKQTNKTPNPQTKKAQK